MRAPGIAVILALNFVPAWGETPPQKTYVRHEPDGKGDPAAITCRRPQALPGQRVLGPEVCRPNADWAQFAKDGMTVAPDGVNLVPSEKSRSLNPAACGPTSGSAPTSTAGMASRGGMTC